MNTLFFAFAVLSANPAAGSSPGVLLDFTATWCGPCQQMSPIVSRLERAGFPIRRVDLDQNQALARQYGVSSIPCFVLVVNGREVTRIVGQTTEAELRRLCDQIPREESPVAFADDRAPEGAGRAPIRNASGSMAENATKPKEPAEPARKKGLLPSLFGRKDDRKPANPFDDAETIRGNNEETAEPNSSTTGNPFAASVRIKVRDARGVNFGTGSIIVSKPGRTLILTCAHLFRGLPADAPIIVEVFSKGKSREYAAKLIDSDEKSDVGLITIPTEGTLPTVTVAPMTTPMAVGDKLYSIGCSGGETPSRMAAAITAINKYDGPDNLECTGMPVPGRSGGGLFNEAGEVMGVCFAAYEPEKLGLYTGLKPIYSLLQRAGVLPAGDRGGQEDDKAFAAAEPKERRAHGRGTAPGAGSFDAEALLGAELGREPGGAGVTGELPDESVVRNAEVVCIIRPKDQKQGTRIVIIHQAGPRFLTYLQGETRPGTRPTAARFPFDPTMNLAENLRSRGRYAMAGAVDQHAGSNDSAPAELPAASLRRSAGEELDAPAGYERYRRSDASRHAKVSGPSPRPR